MESPDHDHEPELSTLRSISMGKNPNLLDRDEYPIVAECQECGRYIRCETIDAPWLDPHQKAGTAGTAWPVPSRYAPAAGNQAG